jgi:hypothetical protein
MPIRVVINKCYGGFGLSIEAQKRILELQGKQGFAFAQLHKKGDNERQYHLSPYVEVNNDNEAFSVTVFDSREVNENTYIDERSSYLRFVKGWWEEHAFSDRDLKRDDPLLIQVVEELGSERASGSNAKLAIVEIPDGINWEIDEYDGTEWIAEVHRVWS